MTSCAVCGELQDFVRVDLEADETLPPAASKLEVVGDGKVRRCPSCGAHFLYTYDYEYGALGDGWETAELERIDGERAAAVLRDEKPRPRADDLASLVFRAAAAQTDPNPDVRLAAVQAAFAPPAPPQMRAFRCPACGSTDAGPDESRSRVDLTYMQCNACGHGGFFDSWQRDFEWTAADPPTTATKPVATPTAKPAPSTPTIDPPWRESDYDPTVLRSPPPAPSRGTPVDWLLSAEEVDELWSLGVPLEASWIPDEQLRVALANRRVKRSVSTSSMGTTETYWSPAEATADLASVRRNGVVVPPGKTALGSAYEDRADDRDVDRVLWEPFYREQYRAIVRRISTQQRDVVLADLAEMLASLEEQWGSGPKREADESFLSWLRSDGPVDPKELARWLGKKRKRSVRHLVDGVRARWISHDIESACDALLESAKRFKDDEIHRTARLELLRCLRHHARARTT